MKIRSFKELYEDLKDIEFKKTNENVVTGEEYENWVKERFRNLTDEEEKAYVEALESISEPTGGRLYE